MENDWFFKIHWATNIIKICPKNWPTKCSTPVMSRHSFGSHLSPEFKWSTRSTVRQVYRSSWDYQYYGKTTLALFAGVICLNLLVWFLRFDWLNEVNVNSDIKVSSKNPASSFDTEIKRNEMIRHPSVAIMDATTPYFWGFLGPSKIRHSVSFRPRASGNVWTCGEGLSYWRCRVYQWTRCRFQSRFFWI